jgi:L-iditol 2-dehydrogenase
MVEPVAVAAHAAGLGSPGWNDSVVVTGAGMIGLFLIQVLRSKGCGKIIAVDLDQGKLELAEKLGADLVLNPVTDDIADKILAITHNRGADFAFEVVGIESTVETSINSVRKGGTVVLVGNVSPSVKIPLQSVVTRQLKLQGSCAIAGEYEAVLDMIARKQINMDPILSAEVPLSEGAAWFERLYRKEPGLIKVVMIP